MEPLLNKNEVSRNQDFESVNLNHKFNKTNPELNSNAEIAESSNIAEINKQVNDALSSTVIKPTIPNSLPNVDNTKTIAASTVLLSPDTPKIAEDTDIIEKEWVRAAEKIIENTKNNPHERDDQVSGLRKDYKNKRYPNKKVTE